MRGDTILKKNVKSGVPRKINAFLGESTVFKGLLSFEGTVRIDGKVEGEIVTKDTLVVGEKADIKAEIKVGSVIINGKVYDGFILYKSYIIGEHQDQLYCEIKPVGFR